MELKPMTNHPDYAVTPQGDVYSKKSGRWKKLRPQADTDGYLQVRLYENGKNRLTFVHRLVAEMYIPRPRNCNEVNHIDGHKQNNSVDNLEWCSRRDNILHGHDHGLYRTRKPTIATKLETGDKMNFSGQREAARILGVNQGNINHALKKGSNAYGYKFEYVEVK